MKDTIDTTRLTLLLNELRLPAIKHLWEKFAERSDKEGWTAARLLMALAEGSPLTPWQHLNLNGTTHDAHHA